MRSGGKRRLPPWLKSSRLVRDVEVELGGLVDHTKSEWLGNSEISWGSSQKGEDQETGGGSRFTNSDDKGNQLARRV